VRLTVRGGVGDFQLGWRQPADAPAAPQTSVLSVEGRLLTTIDGRSIRTEAELRVESYGGPVERFRVRLPAGATLIPPPLEADDGARPRFSRIAPTDNPARGPDGGPDGGSDGGPADAPVWLVTLPEPTLGPVAVKLVTERPVGLDERAEIDLAGFEVLGAARQYGDMAIRVDQDWRLRWGEPSMARRIDVGLLPEPLRRPGVTDAVRYYRQPWRQPVRVTLLGNRIEATPRYRLEISPEEATLRTTIAYRIPGARVAGFEVDLRDWTRLTPPRPSSRWAWSTKACWPRAKTACWRCRSSSPCRGGPR
ncbi:MAG: hypothetical protein AAF790_09990, partial [Planctomycetota bacterium]